VRVSLRQRGKAGSGGTQPDDKSSAAADVDVVAGLAAYLKQSMFRLPYNLIVDSGGYEVRHSVY